MIQRTALVTQRCEGGHLRYLEFLKTGALVTPIVFAMTLVALYLSLIM
jgi:Na+/H+ antiporter NhaD/arsenite permease-like protein